MGTFAMELPQETPGFPPIAQWIDGATETVRNLEELGDSEIIRQRIIWERQCWIWMKPDCYAC
jgi:hypothetical protein